MDWKVKHMGPNATNSLPPFAHNYLIHMDLTQPSCSLLKTLHQMQIRQGRNFSSKTPLHFDCVSRTFILIKEACWPWNRWQQVSVFWSKLWVVGCTGCGGGGVTPSKAFTGWMTSQCIDLKRKTFKNVAEKGQSLTRKQARPYGMEIFSMANVLKGHGGFLQGLQWTSRQKPKIDMQEAKKK